ncbi:MAG: hypothetical protein M3X11_12065, partial [Acidobacteriota bacterium]|nr:hypothetical protein [Acidobacteriota bacterium]
YRLTGIPGVIDGIAGEGPGGGGGGKASADGSIAGRGGGAGFLRPGQNGGGGASATHGSGGSRYAAFSLLPLIGGSGGGGGSGIGSMATGGASDGFGGGGGGGAILISSETSIAFTPGGRILANGGNTPMGDCSIFGRVAGGGGSGGAIRLVAPTMSGTVAADVYGGRGNCGSGDGAPGFVKIEANAAAAIRVQIVYINPSFGSGSAATTCPNSTEEPVCQFGTLPSVVTPTILPSLRILSVASLPSPANPAASFGALPDITLPATSTDNADVRIEGTNMPVGTQVSVTVTPESGAATTVITSLTGTTTPPTATANVPLRPGYNLIYATAIVDITTTAMARPPLFIKGERVRQMEVATASNGKSQITFITESGKRIPQTNE